MSRRPVRERRRVVGAEVVAGDYCVLDRGAMLWLVEAVRVDGKDVEVTFAAATRGSWKTLFRSRELVHVWRLVEGGR